MTIEFRAYKPGDEKQILELFQETYKKPLSLDYWKWRFADNPFDRPQIYMAFDGAKMVGHYAISPVRFQYDGQEALLAHSMTTMTHPAYQGMGLFTKLAKGLYEELKLQNYEGVWGFPNNNSYYGFVKNLEWKPILEIPFLVCSTGGDRQSSLIPQFEFSQEALSMSFQENVGLLRSPGYLEWRYQKNPSQKYGIVSLNAGQDFLGYLVYKEFVSQSGTSVDLLETEARSVQDLALILEWARIYFLKEKKFQSLTAWCNIHSDSYLSFLKQGFTPAGRTTYMGGLSFSAMSKGAWLDPRGWHISMGDSDVF